MIDTLLRWSLAHRVVVLVLAAVLLGWGAHTARSMPVDVFPDLTAPTVTVLTEGHGMAPEELETRVTFPIESSLNGAPGIRRVRSTTGVGISVIYAEFEWGTDVFRARQIVGEKLQLVRGALPAEVETPVLAPISSIMGEVLFLAVTTGEPATAMDARTFADFTLRRRLLAVPGVSQVIVTGGDRKQFEVALRPEKLVSYGLTTGEVVRALEATNASVSAGFLNEGGQEYLVHGQGRVHSPEDIGETWVAQRGTEPVLVRHLGQVRLGAALRRGEGSYGGRPAVVVGIQKQPGTNTLDLTRRLDRELDDLSRALPAGLSIQRNVFRQADFIEIAIHNVVAALRDGVVLVLIIVLVFLASARASAITIVAIPLSLVTATLALSAAGATLNTMTLGGMAIAVGELVDDAVIDVENVLRRLRENALLPAAAQQSSLGVVLTASREIRSSIVFATLVVVLVFLPLFFLSGVEGRLLAPLGIAYVVSLGASLLVAVTVTPVLCSYLLPGSKAVDRGEPRLVAWLKAAYAPLLRSALQRWRTVAAISVGLLATSAVGLTLAGRSFLPEFKEGTLTIAAVTLPGTSLAESDAMGKRLENMLLRHPEVVSVARRTGRAELDEHAQGVNAAELDVSLRGTKRSREAFLEALRRDFSLLPGVNVTIGQPISHRIDHMLSGTRASIAVKLFGDDLGELRRVGTEVETAMRGVPGIVDLAREQQADIPFVRVRFDRVSIARHGLRIDDVAQALAIGSGVHVVSQILEGPAVFDLVVRMDPTRVATIEDLQELLVVTPRGAQVPLRALASVQRDRGPNEIGRENVQRKVVISCNVAGRDVVGVVRDIQAALARDVKLPPGYHVVYGGQFESTETATRTLALLGGLSLLGIVGLLTTAFGSLRDAALVMANLPLALIGGAVGVWLEGGVLSVASLVGFITLFGIATRNGIMLIAHIRHLQLEEGVHERDEAIRRGAEERLVPILMTACAAGLGLVPLALSGGAPGSEIQAPMAVVILCGLVSSTALNMFVVPALYRQFGAAARTPSAGAT